ncbi:MAG: FeoA family protein [Mycoplasmatales bacterium]
MKLKDIELDKKYKINKINYLDNTEIETISSFGIFEQQVISLLNIKSQNNTYYIDVDDSKFYISSELANRIEVEQINE